jgi:hypothetical protein
MCLKTIFLKNQYKKAIEKLQQLKRIKQGTQRWYFMEFLKTKDNGKWWSQAELIEYCNDHVKKDGGVLWYTKSGGKKDDNGKPLGFADAPRQLEKIRQEDFDGCFDSNYDSKFRLNPYKALQFEKSTKTHTFSNKIKQTILKRANGTCELCGYKGKLEIDHFIPREKGGKSTEENANALCSRCNDRKCNKDPNLFAKEEAKRLYTYFKSRGRGDKLKDIFNEFE